MDRVESRFCFASCSAATHFCLRWSSMTDDWLSRTAYCYFRAVLANLALRVWAFFSPSRRLLYGVVPPDSSWNTSTALTLRVVCLLMWRRTPGLRRGDSRSFCEEMNTESSCRFDQVRALTGRFEWMLYQHKATIYPISDRQSGFSWKDFFIMESNPFIYLQKKKHKGIQITLNDIFVIKRPLQNYKDVKWHVQVA